MQNIIDFAKKYFSKGSHGWDHTLRVHNMCLHIGNIENADIRVLELAAYLHDIAREEQDESNGKICHAEKGAELAEEILRKLDYDERVVSQVCHCIATHRFRKSYPPETKEARILYDADKLDSIGAIGIARAVAFSAEIGAVIHDKNVTDKQEDYSYSDCAYREFLVKLRKIKDQMLTDEGKRIAKSRHEFMVEFFDRLNKEVDGLN